MKALALNLFLTLSIFISTNAIAEVKLSTIEGLDQTWQAVAKAPNKENLRFLVCTNQSPYNIVVPENKGMAKFVSYEVVDKNTRKITLSVMAKYVDFVANIPLLGPFGTANINNVQAQDFVITLSYPKKNVLLEVEDKKLTATPPPDITAKISNRTIQFEGASKDRMLFSAYGYPFEIWITSVLTSACPEN